MSNRIVLPTLLLISISLSDTRADLVSYTGEPIDGSAGTGIVSATFDFSIPLTDGAVLNETHLSSWTIAAVGRNISNSNATFFDAEFTIGPSLLPVSWAFFAERDIEADPRPEQIHSINPPASNSPVSFGFDALYVDDNAGNSVGWSQGVGYATPFSTGDPGTWAVVPEPSAFLHGGLISVLVGCGCWVKRRSA